MVQPMPYVTVQQLTDPGCPWGIRDYFKVDYLTDLPDEAIDAAVKKAEEIGSPFTQLIFCPLGGALAKADRSTMAMNLPDAKRLYFCLAMWWDEALDDAEIAWSRSLMETMRPWASDDAEPAGVAAPAHAPTQPGSPQAPRRVSDHLGTAPALLLSQNRAAPDDPGETPGVVTFLEPVRRSRTRRPPRTRRRGGRR
jgi:hypothetical protein